MEEHEQMPDLKDTVSLYIVPSAVTKNSKSTILGGPQNGRKIAHACMHELIRNSLLAHWNFKHRGDETFDGG